SLSHHTHHSTQASLLFEPVNPDFATDQCWKRGTQHTAALEHKGIPCLDTLDSSERRRFLWVILRDNKHPSLQQTRKPTHMAAFSMAHAPGMFQLGESDPIPSQQMEETPQLRKSCDYCVRMKRGCDGGTPCALCTRRNKHCIRSVKKRSGPAKGTKYCKRKPRKTSNTAPKRSSPASAGGGASAAGTASSPSGGPSALGGGGGNKSGVLKVRLPASKKTKREGGAAPRVLASNGTVHGGISPLKTAASLAGSLHNPKHELAATTPAAVALDASSSQQQQQQQMRYRGQEVVGGGGGRGVKANFGGAIDGLGSRRSSFGGGLIAMDSDRRHSPDADGCSGSLLPFYFAAYDSECGGGDGGGGGRGVDSSWEDASISGGGGGGAAAEDGSGGRSAAQEARMMATRRSSLEEVFYGACYKRSTFLPGGISSPSSSYPQQEQEEQQQQPNHPLSSAVTEGVAWNQLWQQPDGVAAASQGAAAGSDDPAGGILTTPFPLTYHSPSFEGVCGDGGMATDPATTPQHQQRRQQ
ncbi:unnamed protein product, partial [Pylaiella littoralis]